jgi:putative DNA primase/helicase
VSLEDEFRERRRKDNLEAAKFFVCPSCYEIIESYDYLDKCTACGLETELTEASTEQNARSIIAMMQQPGYNRVLGKKISDAVEEDVEEQNKANIRIHLLKGQWFIKGAEVLIKENPVFYDRTGAWWVWNHDTCCWEERDETDILVMVRKTLTLLGDTSVRHGKRLIEALRQVSRGLEPKEPPTEYVQFGRELVNIHDGSRIVSTPEYFSTNQVPWNVGATTDTPEMDKLIISWVGERYLQTMYEILAYCVYRDYPIHRVFCFVGNGANGKTRLLKIIEKFVGANNKASVTLKKLGNNDFALYPLYRKTVCFVGETAHHRLESTEILKALSGQDPVSFEDKGRTAFTGQNYAKLIIGTNVLPPSSDSSRGWYRRWFIVNFPNEFEEGEDVLKRIPENEYENLAAKCIKLLPLLLKKGGFDQEGTIAERQQKYMENSNPLRSFIKEFYDRDPDNRIKYTECYIEYLQFLARKKMRKVSKKEFSAALEDESFETQRTSIRDDLGETSTYTIIWGLRRKPMQREISEQETLHSWHVWLDSQPGGTAEIDTLINEFPGLNISKLLNDGEAYEPRPGFVRRII